MLYPWHETTWQQLMQRREQLPHAILLHGQAGTGKLAFAQHLIAGVLCRQVQPDGQACGHCQSCHWLAEGTHPDIQRLQPAMQDTKTTKNKPAKRKQFIVIDQVRALADFIHLTSHQHASKRVVLISPADTLNQAAANALLKMLEEPSGDAMFVLVTDQIQRLLPTVLSRCVKVAMPTPEKEIALKWLNSQNITGAENTLAYHAGSPLLAAAGINDQEYLTSTWKLLSQGARLMPAELATKLTQPSVEQGVIALQKWLYDLVLFKQTGQLRYHPSLRNTFERLTDSLALDALSALQKQLESLRKLASHPLNHELQLEALLLEYTRLFK